jgi:hypothetical protein
METAQRDGLVVRVDERGEHHDLLPPVQIVDADLTLLRPRFLILPGSDRCLRAHRGAHDHHR